MKLENSLGEISNENINNLPPNWTRVRIAEICKTTSGGTPRRSNTSYYRGNIPWLKSGELEYNTITSSEEHITGDAIDNSSSKIIAKGTILMALYGATVGKLAILGIDAAINQAICAIFTPNGVENKFLYWYLFGYRHKLLNSRKGGAQPNISQQIVNDIMFPLPPLNEQKRIVSKLEELFTKLESGIEAIKKTKILLKQYRQSVLRDAFEGKLTAKWRNNHKNEIEPVDILLEKITKRSEKEKVRRDVPSNVDVPDELISLEIPRTWLLISVAQLLRKGALIDLKDGNHGGNHPKADEFSLEGLPFITASQVNNFKIDYEKAPKLKGKPLEKLKVGFSSPGDIIITHKGTVGRVAVSTRECVLSPQTTYYRINKKLINEHFLSYFFASTVFQGQLTKVKSQTTRDFVSILKQYSLFVLLSHPFEQEEIVKVIDQYFSIIDNAEKMININLNYSNRMLQSILKQAFEGNLVAQNPKDEPAEMLLQRIQQKSKNEKDQFKQH